NEAEMPGHAFECDQSGQVNRSLSEGGRASGCGLSHRPDYEPGVHTPSRLVKILATAAGDTLPRIFLLARDHRCSPTTLSDRPMAAPRRPLDGACCTWQRLSQGWRPWPHSAPAVTHRGRRRRPPRLL